MPTSLRAVCFPLYCPLHRKEFCFVFLWPEGSKGPPKPEVEQGTCKVQGAPAAAVWSSTAKAAIIFASLTCSAPVLGGCPGCSILLPKTIAHKKQRISIDFYSCPRNMGTCHAIFLPFCVAVQGANLAAVILSKMLFPKYAMRVSPGSTGKQSAFSFF